MPGPLSQGRLKDHPLHPLVVHLPIGLWVGSLIFDVLFLATGNARFGDVAFYTLVAGLAGVLLAVPTGMIEFSHTAEGSRPRSLAITHAVLNVVVTVLYLVNFVVRRGQELPDGAHVTTGLTFVLSLISIGILAVSGYIGGQMVYQYGLGMHPERRSGARDKSDRRVA